MLVRHFQDDIYAYTETDAPGVTIIHWVQPDIAPCEDDIQCYGWIEGGMLFAPSDGDYRTDWHVEGGTPDRDAHWYAVSTGFPALHGIPGATLAVL